MFILGVGTSPSGKARVGKSNTINAGVGGGRPLTSPAPGSVGRRSTISYDQAKTSSASTERTNEVSRYSDIQLSYLFQICNLPNNADYIEIFIDTKSIGYIPLLYIIHILSFFERYI